MNRFSKIRCERLRGQPYSRCEGLREEYEQPEKAIKANHSYDVPEIIATPVLAGNKDYLAWMGDETKG